MSKLATFETALLFTLIQEGGYSDIAADKGGVTNLGITKDDAEEYFGRPVSNAEMRALTKEVATKIYRKVYWDEDFSKVPYAIGVAVFDWGVLHGIYYARRQAQQALNKIGFKLSVDGDIGPASITAMQKVDEKKFLDAYVTLIKASMNSIAANDSSQKQFLKGWLARADRISQLTSN